MPINIVIIVKVAFVLHEHPCQRKMSVKKRQEAVKCNLAEG